MTLERNVDELLDRWMADGPTGISDRAFDEIVEAIRRQPQRPAWRLRPWRFPTMSASIRLTILVGALLVAALAGAVFIAGSPRPSTPAPPSQPPESPLAVAASTAPSRSPAPSPTIRPGCDNVTTQGCFLPAGAHRTAAYAPEITYTVPSGWMTTNDAPSAFALAPATHENLASLDASGRSLTTINIERDLALGPETCTGSAGAALPRTADAIVRGLAQRQGMLAGVPAPVSLGGLSGWTVDLRVNPVGPRLNCTSRNGTSGIPELIGPGPISHEAFDLAPGVIQRLIVLDLPGGGNVTILISAQKAELWDAFLGQATPVVDSFSFSQAG